LKIQGLGLLAALALAGFARANPPPAGLSPLGIATREIVPGLAFVLSDLEGNPVELWTPPSP